MADLQAEIQAAAEQMVADGEAVRVTDEALLAQTRHLFPE